MSRRAGGPAPLPGLAAVALLTVWVVMASWHGFVADPSGYLTPVLLLGGAVVGAGVLARWARLSAPLVVLVQLALGAWLLAWYVGGTPLPLGAGWTAVVDGFAQASATAREFAAPVPESAAPVHPLLVAGGLGVVLLVDVVAATLRRAPLAGLPLLAAYSIPVSLLGSQVEWWVFAAGAAGFVAMLYLHGAAELARWGRTTGGDGAAAPGAESEDTSGRFGQSGPLRLSAARIGVVAVVVAVLAPAALPSLGLQLLDGGFGRGGGDDEITIENPMIDMRRDLQRGDDLPLMRIDTDDPDPGYLRIAVLNRFTDEQWSSGDRDVPRSNSASGAMPPIEGLSSSVPRNAYSYQIDVTDDFDSTWLPTQAPIARIDAPGDWRYDRDTMDFLASSDGLDTRGMSYSLTAVEPQLSAAALAAATPGSPEIADELTALPDDFPEELRELTADVTDGAETAFDQALALQRWFRVDGGFQYTLQRDPGNGTASLVSFLTDPDDRFGYCEQFAASMAVMARVLGIPARVAIGLMTPDQVANQTWEYSGDDLHAWPELYFRGAGWVRFEPTPAVQAPEVPAYTGQEAGPEGPETDPSAGPSQQPAPSAEPSPRQRPDNTPQEDAATADRDAGDGGPRWGVILGAQAVALALLALLVGPCAWRRRLRERRLRGGPEQVWRELAATVEDLGAVWPAGRSPRATRDRLVPLLGGIDPLSDDPDLHDPADREALDRLVARLERLRYAPAGAAGPDGADEQLTADGRVCVAALERGATPAARRRARWAPRSLRRSWRPPAEPQDSQTGAHDLVGSR